MIKSFYRKAKAGIEFSVFVTPALVLLCISSLIPFMMNIYYAFTDWNGLGKSLHFIGFDHFIDMFANDRNFAQSIRFTLKFTLFYVVIQNVIAFMLALLVVRPRRGNALYRVSVYIPNIMSVVIIGYMWRFIFNIAFVELAKLPGLSFLDVSILGHSDHAFWALVLISSWKSMGFFMMIYVAGMVSLPKDVMEMSVVDGVSGLKKLIHITIPLVMYAITICIFISLVESFKTFELIFSLTGGGPGRSTTNIAYNIYVDAFHYNLFGYGAAKSLIYFLGILIISVTQMWLFKNREVQH